MDNHTHGASDLRPHASPLPLGLAATREMTSSVTGRGQEHRTQVTGQEHTLAELDLRLGPVLACVTASSWQGALLPHPPGLPSHFLGLPGSWSPHLQPGWSWRRAGVSPSVGPLRPAEMPQKTPRSQREPGGVHWTRGDRWARQGSSLQPPKPSLSLLAVTPLL